ncbi:metallophosphoesterase family protein [Microlunatus soli]|uniref:Calcineurin-like phosphoesterase n=1 Tax=Microlunatus soli TaxID=630515 RepID=A0A1H1QLJ3_9ACTN|nr:metallophosphoesterase [Microlunatus soli]SDS24265.1 Calcineurin-like phosphoesterase [Microlunatus soli]
MDAQDHRTAESLAPTELVDSPPVLMAPRSDGIEVVWSVTAPSRGWVEWLPGSIDPDTARAVERRVVDLDRYGFVPQGSRVIRVRIDGWDPGADYTIRTVTEAAADGHRQASDWKQVRTLDPSADSTSFVVWNDTHQRSETLQRLDDASPQADFWVWNGDICNNWNDPEEIAPTVLAPAGRDVTAGRPLSFVWGNHDVRGPWAYRLSEVIATPDDRPYYALRSGPVAAIFLNTGEDKPDDHPTFGGRPAFEQLRRVQADWLAEQITRPGFVDAPYRVVFCHLPLRWVDEPVLTEADYAGGDWDHYSRVSRDLWDPHLRAWGAQVVISGHTHRSTWIPADDDFPYAQLTGGGPEGWAATWIEGDADAERFTLIARRLDGSVLHEASFTPAGSVPSIR